jgi:hypothetical protein
MNKLQVADAILDRVLGLRASAAAKSSPDHASH